MAYLQKINVNNTTYEIAPNKLLDSSSHVIAPPTNLSSNDTIVTERNLTGYTSSDNYRGLSMSGHNPYIYIPNADSSTTGLMTSFQFNRLTSAYNASCADPLVRSYTNISNSGMETDKTTTFDLWTTTKGSYTYARIPLGNIYSSVDDTSNCYSILISGVVGGWAATDRMFFSGSIGTRGEYTFYNSKSGVLKTSTVWFTINGSVLNYYTNSNYTIAHLIITAPSNYFEPNTSLGQYFTNSMLGTTLDW